MVSLMFINELNDRKAFAREEVEKEVRARVEKESSGKKNVVNKPNLPEKNSDTCNSISGNFPSERE